MDSIIVYSNIFRGEYFFTTDHCQRLHSEKTKEACDESWVPVTTFIPHRVAPRKGIENGIVDSLEKLILVYHSEEREIPNPDPAFVPDYRKESNGSSVP